LTGHSHREIPPAGVEIIGDKNIPVLAVAAPVTEAEEAAAEAAAGTGLAEVEVIKEKTEETADGAAPATKAGPAAKGAPPAKGAEKLAEKAPEKGGEKKAEKKK
jgi:hypothetical protein